MRCTKLTQLNLLKKLIYLIKLNYFTLKQNKPGILISVQAFHEGNQTSMFAQWGTLTETALTDDQNPSKGSQQMPSPDSEESAIGEYGFHNRVCQTFSYKLSSSNTFRPVSHTFFSHRIRCFPSALLNCSGRRAGTQTLPAV